MKMMTRLFINGGSFRKIFYSNRVSCILCRCSSLTSLSQFRRKLLQTLVTNNFLPSVLVLVGGFGSLPSTASAWNIPGHMVTASVAYQILREEKPTAIGAVRAILEQHPWYAERWREHLEKIPEAERDEFLFMLAARWPDDIRTRDRAQHRGPWHYTNFPFKPAGQPDSVTTKPPEPVNILTALALNEKLANTEADAGRRAVALAWLFHLVGDVHQPLHT